MITIVGREEEAEETLGLGEHHTGSEEKVDSGVKRSGGRRCIHEMLWATSKVDCD